MSEFMEHTICIETPDGCLDDLSATFDVDQETCPAEPTSWGDGRGTETETTAEFYSCRFGGLTIDRAMLVQILNETAVAAIEETAADELAEGCADRVRVANETVADDRAHAKMERDL